MILLTGATGFLGSHILRFLLEKDYEVIILKRSFSNIWRVQDLLKDTINYDLDKISLENIFEENEIKIVIHCATLYGRKGEKSSELLESNVIFPTTILEYGKDIDSFLNIDTFSNQGLGLDNSVNFYSYTKYIFEELLRNQFYTNIKIFNLKLDFVFGPKDSLEKFLPSVIMKMIENESVKMTKGEQNWNFIYVDDVVNAVGTILNRSNEFSRPGFYSFDVGTQKNTKLKDIVLMIRNLSDSKSKIDFGAIEYRKNEIFKRNNNIEPLLKLGWKPKYSIEEGLKNTINWYKRNQKGLI